MKILITGGAGFIGLHTIEELLQAGHSVRVIDDFSTGNEELLRSLVPAEEIFEMSLLQNPYFRAIDYPPLYEAFQGVDAILHLAAKVSVVESLEDPFGVSYTNVMGMIRTLQCAREYNIPRVVYASSAAVYGDLGYGIATDNDDDLKLRPVSPYGLDKLTNERYASLFNTQTIGLRYFNVYGPRQDHRSPYSGVISKFCAAGLKNEEDLTINGDGEQTRNFIYVKDIARANRMALTAKGPLSTFKGVVNVGYGGQDSQTSIKTLAKTIISQTRADIGVKHNPPIAGDIRFSNPDLQKFSFLFQDLYKKMTPLEKGLPATIKEMKLQK